MGKTKGAKNISRDEIENIRNLYLIGYPVAAIAAKTGRDKSTIRDHTKDLRPKRNKPFTDEAMKKIVPLLPEIFAQYSNGKSIADIAKENSVSDDYLYSLLKRHNYPIKHKGWNFSAGKYNVDPFNFIETWQTSETTQEVCERLSMPYRAVLSRAIKYRNKGVPLKQLRHANRVVDWEGLERFALGFMASE